MALSSSSSSSAEINVTPLIDVLLVLLIIFMVIVPTRSRGLDSQLPQGHSEAIARLPPVTVRLVAAPGSGVPRLLVDAHEVHFADLGATLHALFAVRQDPTLFVEADRALSYQQVAAVVAQGKLAGATHVALSGLPR